MLLPSATQDVALLGGEAAPVAVEQAHRTDRAGLHDERQIRGRGDLQPGDAPPQLRVALGELLRGLDEARAEGAHRLAHRVPLVDPGEFGAGHEAARGAFRDEPDPAGLDQSHHQTGRAQMGEAVGVLEDVDDVLHGPGVGERGGGQLDHVGLLTAQALLEGLVAAVAAVLQFLGGVADDADDAVGPAGLVPPDVALGVGPAQGAVAAADAEVGAVVLLAGVERAGHDGVQPPRLRGRDADGQGLGPVVVLVGAHVEDLVRLGVHLHHPGVQVPVETAHAVERQDRIRVFRPVVRE
ncbi:hypothetical protein RKD47_000460 [Streptomyces albogriseolus]